MKIDERIHGRIAKRNRDSLHFNRLLFTFGLMIAGLVFGGLTPTVADAQGSSEETKDVSFDDIKFDIEPDGDFDRSMLTDEIESLVGKKIRIRGYILPGFNQELKQFVLVRDNQECCFGPGAALFDCVAVTMVGGKTANYTVRPVAVEGVFSVKELPGPGGKPLAIYRLKATSVR